MLNLEDNLYFTPTYNQINKKINIKESKMGHQIKTKINTILKICLSS